MAETVQTRDLKLGHRYRIPSRRGGVHDGVYEGAWAGLHHFTGAEGAEDFAFPTTLDSVEGENLGPASVLDLVREQEP